MNCPSAFGCSILWNSPSGPTAPANNPIFLYVCKGNALRVPFFLYVDGGLEPYARHAV